MTQFGTLIFITAMFNSHLRHVIDEREGATYLKTRGAVIQRENEVRSGLPGRLGQPPFEPRGAWVLRTIIGDDIFERVDTIDIAGRKFDDKEMAQVAKCRQVVTLIADWNDITDAGLVHICKCRSLRAITLDGTKVTDDGLLRLETLDLVYLSIHRTNIGAGAIAKFKRAKPECVVESNTGP